MKHQSCNIKQKKCLEKKKTASYNQKNPKTTGQYWFKLIFKYYFAYELPRITQLPKCGETADLCNFTAGQTLEWQELRCKGHSTRCTQSQKQNQ